MLVRTLLVWIVLLCIAIANGAFREGLLTPTLGAPAAHIISTLMLAAFIVIAGWVTIPWVAPATLEQAWAVGVVWLALTVGFEFLAGHYLFGKPWSALAADYNVLAGRIWVVVLVVTAIAPVLAFSRRLVS